MTVKVLLIYVQNSKTQLNLLAEYIQRCSTTTFYVIATDENFYLSTYQDADNISWFNQEDWNERKSLIENESLCNTLAESLYQVADSLYYSGDPVSLFSILPESLEQESNLELYGALYRLKQWNNVKPVFITMSDTMPESVVSLTQFLEADILDEILKPEEELVWMGKISVMNKCDDKGFQFCGFSLSCDDQKAFIRRVAFCHGVGVDSDGHGSHNTFHLGRMIEILDHIDVTTVPSFLISSLTLQLHLNIENPASRLFLQEIHSQSQHSALIGRIATYKTSDLTTCVNMNHIKTSSWKEALMNDITCIREPEEELLPGYQYVHFIITKDSNRNEIDMGELKLTILKSPKEINGKMLGLLEKSIVKPHEDIEGANNELIPNLPYMKNLNITLLHNHLNWIQVELLKEWIGEQEKKKMSTVLPQSQLASFLETTQRLFITSIFQTHKESHCAEEDEIEKATRLSDLNMDPKEWPERIALQHFESKQKCLKRYKSSDSMPLSSPFYPQDSGTSIDAVEFLRFFQADGTAAKDKLSPVRKKTTSGRSIKRLSSHDSLTSWPECKEVNYHDIYYYSKAEDKQFAKVRDKFMKEESYCSLYNPSYGKPKAKKIEKTKSIPCSSSGHILSPTRRSPRGRKRKLCDDSLHMSQVKQNIGLRSPTKQALRQLKSPRKRPTILSPRKRPRAQSPRKRTTLPSPRKKTALPSPRKKPVTQSPRKKLSHLRQCSPRKGVRQSPRKPASSSRSFSFSESQPIRKLPAPCIFDEDSCSQSNVFGNYSSSSEVNTIEVRKKRNSTDGLDSQTSKTGETRSQRHRRKLEEICTSVLELNGIEKSNPIFKSCSSNLYQVTKFFVKALPNAHSLSQEMRRIAEGQVLQVIDLEKRRQELSHKKKNAAA